MTGLIWKNEKMTKRKMFLLTASIFVLLLSAFFVEFKVTAFFKKKHLYSIEKIISPKDLLEGDIIFWKIRDTDNRSGHVAVVTTASDIAEKVRISHATDHPNYNAFVETYLQPTKKVEKQNRYYYVVRIRNFQVKKYFLSILREWLNVNIPFNAANEALMNKWDDAMVEYSNEAKFQQQNQLFLSKSSVCDIAPSDGYMCSEVIITALQKAFLIKFGSTEKMPNSLWLDPVLCPPSTMMLGLIQDSKNFQIVGELVVPNFTFNQKERDLHKQ